MKVMNRFLLALLAAAGLMVMTSAPAAAQVPGDYDRDYGYTQLRTFDAFLDSHGGIKNDLYRNPNLVNDPWYLNRHPQLAEFLWRHPGIREELRDNPRGVLYAQRRYDGNEWRWRRGDGDNDRDDWRWRRGDGDHDRDDARWRNRDRDDYRYGAWGWRDRDGDHDRDDRRWRDRDRDRDHDRDRDRHRDRDRDRHRDRDRD